MKLSHAAYNLKGDGPYAPASRLARPAGEEMARAIASFVFKCETLRYEILDEVNGTATDIIHRQLGAFIEENRLNEAENLLFANMAVDD